MKIKLLSILIVVLLLTIIFSGCNEQKSGNNIETDSAKFIGTWKYPLNSGTSCLYWTFNNNGTIKEEFFMLGNTSINWGAYTIESNKICFKSQFIVHLPEGASTTCYSYHFSDDGQMLNLTKDNGVTTILTREGMTVLLNEKNVTLSGFFNPITYEPTGKIYEFPISPKEFEYVNVSWEVTSYNLNYMSGIAHYLDEFPVNVSVFKYESKEIMYGNITDNGTEVPYVYDLYKEKKIIYENFENISYKGSIIINVTDENSGYWAFSFRTESIQSTVNATLNITAKLKE